MTQPPEFSILAPPWPTPFRLSAWRHAMILRPADAFFAPAVKVGIAATLVLVAGGLVGQHSCGAGLPGRPDLGIWPLPAVWPAGPAAGHGGGGPAGRRWWRGSAGCGRHGRCGSRLPCSRSWPELPPTCSQPWASRGPEPVILVFAASAGSGFAHSFEAVPQVVAAICIGAVVGWMVAVSPRAGVSAGPRHGWPPPAPLRPFCAWTGRRRHPQRRREARTGVPQDGLRGQRADIHCPDHRGVDGHVRPVRRAAAPGRAARRAAAMRRKQPWRSLGTPRDPPKPWTAWPGTRRPCARFAGCRTFAPVRRAKDPRVRRPAPTLRAAGTRRVGVKEPASIRHCGWPRLRPVRLGRLGAGPGPSAVGIHGCRGHPAGRELQHERPAGHPAPGGQCARCPRGCGPAVPVSLGSGRRWSWWWCSRSWPSCWC